MISGLFCACLKIIISVCPTIFYILKGMPSKNLFSAVPGLSQGESFDELLRHKNILIERIVSTDKIEAKLYNQPQDEWVALLQGKAKLELSGKEIDLSRGDTCFIPAHTPHRVIATSTKPRCIWLAIHIFADDQ